MSFQPTICSVDELENLCEKIRKSANAKFADLIKDLHIDLSSNKENATQREKLLKEAHKLKRSIKACKVFKWILIIFLIFPFFLLNNAQKKKQGLLNNKDEEIKKLESKLNKQLAPLMPLINNEFCYRNIIEPLWPDIQFNSYLNMLDNANWQAHLKKIVNGESHATNLVSGRLFEHPFIIFNKKEQLWGAHTYVGSVPVTYSDRDSQGHLVTRTTMVTASETLPEPYWTLDTKLVYRTDVASELCFTNQVTKKEFKKAGKTIQTRMEIEEFDKVFKAIRNDEQKYRTVFTLLAQEGITKLFKQRNYVFVKDGDINWVELPNDKNDILLESNIDTSFNYNLNIWQNSFTDCVTNFVYTVGLYSLPICNIPLYQNLKYKWPRELKHGVDLQAMSNMDLCYKTFNLQSLFDTDVIFKPESSSVIKIEGITVSQTKIRCNYFYPKHETIVKTVFGPKGPVSVPIEVIRYIPRYKYLNLFQSDNWKEIKHLDTIESKYLIQNGQFISYSKDDTKPKDLIKSAIVFAKANARKK